MNKGKICISVCSSTAAEMIAKIHRAAQTADVIEVRFDCLDKSGINELIQNLPPTTATYLFTFRPKGQGGHRDLTLADRLKFWEVIFNRHISNFIIDIEAEPKMMMAIRPNKIKRILSIHDFDKVPENLEACLDVTTGEGDIGKIAVAADDITDAIPLWKLLETATTGGKDIIPIAMGEAGKWTRILGPAHGAFMTYASLETGGETAPGQISAEQLIKLYRAKDLTPQTKVFGILGDPVSQSLSTFMHNPAFVSEGFDGVFIPFLVKNIDEFMGRMVRPESREIELNFGGFSVTMPHKRSIMRHLDVIDPTAASIGAVNTVKIDGDELTGYNTDAHGFITPLRERFGELKGVKVAVCGAGGAARACVYALQTEGAEVGVFVRDPERAKAFSEEMGTPVTLISELRPADFDVIVDTTPLGMSGQLENESLFSADELKGVKFVYDLVTKPYDTPIIREAKKAGVPAIGGLEMLVAQGARQFQIWTGKTAPVEQMKASVLARFAELNR